MACSQRPRRAWRACRLLLTFVLLTWSVAAHAREGAPVEVERLAMIGFTVSDMDRSVAFYSDVLMFEKVADFRVNGPPSTIWRACSAPTRGSFT